KELNLRQQRWIELLSDYDCEIRYHLGKENVVADALSRKERDKTLRVRALMMTVHNDLPKQIRKAQEEAIKGENVKDENLGRLNKPIFEFRPDGTRSFRNHVWFLQLVWKWEGIIMDFMSGLPRSRLGMGFLFRSFQIEIAILRQDSGDRSRSVGTNLDMGTTYHPQMDGQSERAIQTLEDSVPKSYADKRATSLEFEVGDMVLLKLSPRKGAVHFRKREKLSTCYVGPFKILARVGPVAYTLELPEELKGIHSTFHVSNLKKCLTEGDIVVLVDEIQLDDNLHMIEEPVEVVDREIKKKYPHLFTSKDEARKADKSS
nr:reverse transcriptase domain-containing protein [Tanacetum cinerariifolium]